MSDEALLAGGYVGRGGGPFMPVIGEIVVRPQREVRRLVAVGGELHGRIIEVPPTTKIVYFAPADPAGSWSIDGKWHAATSITSYEVRTIEGTELLVESSLWRSGIAAGGAPNPSLLRSMVGALGAAYGTG